MDGYIKNKFNAIKDTRKLILYKYSLILIIAVFIPVILFGVVVNQPPEKWTDTEIVYSHISAERVHISSRRGESWVLNSQDGQMFVLKSGHAFREYLSDSLIQGEHYYIVFSETIAGGNVIQAIYNDSNIYLDINDSKVKWQSEQNRLIVSIFVILIIVVVGIILIDKFWCKEEHAKIRRLKADIKRRENRMMNRYK